MEAAGIEPASESTTPKLLHVYFAYLSVGCRHAGEQAFLHPIPLISRMELRASSRGSLLNDALSEAQASSEERAAIG